MLKKNKTPNITDGGFDYWWALADLNRGPKDYENRQPGLNSINRGSASFKYRCVVKCVVI
jgi:hypothetical protein